MPTKYIVAESAREIEALMEAGWLLYGNPRFFDSGEMRQAMTCA